MTTTRRHAYHSMLRLCRRAVAGSSLFTIPVLCLLFTGIPALAQTLTVLHTFTGKGDGKWPTATVIRDTRGDLYGTTSYGGSFPFGTVFKVDTAGKETILHNFWGGDGLSPDGQLIRHTQGVFYGTTSDGGTQEGGSCEYGCGTVFKLDRAGKETVLYAFTGAKDGANPYAGLVRDGDGNLYGIAANGGDLNCSDEGSSGCGVVFKVDTNGKETVLHAFAGPPDGETPDGGLVRDDAGNLYGVTLFGGTSGSFGTVFKVDKSGKETVLYSFNAFTNGVVPLGPFFLDASGNIYGTIHNGGDLSCGYDHQGCGVVFKLDTAGNETVLYVFKGNNDGSYPSGGLIRDKAGNFYGVTSAGGSTGCSGGEGCGTIFELETSGNETVLYSFTGGSSGSSPNGPLVRDKTGNFYGTTYTGGDLSCNSNGLNPGCGVVFKITP